MGMKLGVIARQRIKMKSADEGYIVNVNLFADSEKNPLSQPLLIVPCDTGVVYHNVVGGCKLLDYSAEGYIIPLPFVTANCFNPWIWREKEILSFPPDPKWRKLNPRAIEKTIEDYENWIKVQNCLWYDEVCEEIEHVFGGLIKVIKNAVHEEAWFHVKAKLGSDESLTEKGKWSETILTWCNSD